MKIIRPKQTAEKLGISLATLWRKARNDLDFIKPIKLSDSVTGFIEEEVDAYLERKVREFRERPTKRETAAKATTASATSRAAKRATLTAGAAS